MFKVKVKSGCIRQGGKLHHVGSVLDLTPNDYRKMKKQVDLVEYIDSTFDVVDPSKLADKDESLNLADGDESQEIIGEIKIKRSKK